MIILEEFGRGRFAVLRQEGEEPFAMLVSPSARGKGVRSWGVEYRDGQSKKPFSGHCNLGFSTKAAAVSELARTARVCSEYQLGLEAVLGLRFGRIW